MLITAKWYKKPIIYDNQKYTHESDKDCVKILDKTTKQIILTVFCPIIIKQVASNEFIIIEKTLDKSENKYIMNHVQYNQKLGILQTIYRTKYSPKSTDEEARLIDNIFILEDRLDTTIYNPTTKQSLTLANTKVMDEPAHLKSNYIISQTNIEDKDYLTMYIDKNTLTSEQFYSRLQDRVIPIIKILENNFSYNYKNTIKQEIIKYIRLLDQREDYYNNQSNNKAIQILRKNLKKKNT